MGITTRKPPIKETVGAQHICFSTMDDNNDWTNKFEEEVEKTEVVKSVKVTENSDSSDVWSSGKIYASDTNTSATDVEVEVIAFPEDTLARMRGDNIDESGLILSGGNRVRPYFAYGKTVHLKGGKKRLDWYPKCKLVENSDEIATKEDKANEQTDTIKISAYAFNEEGDIVSRVGGDKFPKGLTEEKWFAKPILTKEDLTEALGGTQTPAVMKVSGK